MVNGKRLMVNFFDRRIMHCEFVITFFCFVKKIILAIKKYNNKIMVVVYPLKSKIVNIRGLLHPKR